MKKMKVLVFSLIMSYSMAIGMEVYNIAYKMGYHMQAGGFSAMHNVVFLAALKEASYMGIIVFIISTLYGNRLGQHIASHICNQERDPAYFCMLIRQGATIAIMCPSMSLIASIIFTIILAHQPLIQLPAIFVGTLMKNFPMAFFWNIFAASPFTRTITKWLFTSK